MDITKGDWKLEPPPSKNSVGIIYANALRVCEVSNLPIDSEANAQLIALAGNLGQVYNIDKLEEVVNSLEQLQKRLELLISATPTGVLRNNLCDENIAALQALKAIKK